MSSEPIIEASGVSKAYLVYAQPADRLKQAIMPRLRRLARPLMRALGRPAEGRPWFREHWALRPLSFEVRRGETVGIIGRNGSGKSTLLQLVCGTLTPTTGEMRVRGRIAALLELGSGFNPEYTGRENVFLNASVLGLSREETQARLDDILAFADIGAFIDQPVKTYSSGMAMRLAFAVIAHVDADILVIDEALAVGDTYFQQKCFRWLHAFQQRGTVLFCGHDTAALVNLCERAIWLDQGVVKMAGAAKDVAEAYVSTAAAEAMGLPAPDMAPGPAAQAAPGDGAGDADDADDLPAHARKGYGSGKAFIRRVRLRKEAGDRSALYAGGERVSLTIGIEAVEALDNIVAGFFLKDRLGQPVVGTNSLEHAARSPVSCGADTRLDITFAFRLPHLLPGTYVLGTSVATFAGGLQTQHHWLHEAGSITVQRPFSSGTLVDIEPEGIRVELRGQDAGP